MRDGTLVALKFFRPGSTYDGAIQRERYILDTFVQVQANIASRMTRMITKTHNVTQLVGNGNKSV